MFSKINTHKYLFMLKLEEFDINSLRIVIAEGGVDEEAPELSDADMPNEKLRDILKGSKPITVSPNNAHYEITFNNYIAYAATNEAYTVTDDGKFDGKIAGTYSESAFLRYVEQATYATQEFPGPFEHYCFWCFNQKIDIVSSTPPTVKEIAV